MDNCVDRAIFMPDLVADADYTLKLTTGSDKGYDSFTLTINKGDWWANMYAFLLHFWEQSGYQVYWKPVLGESTTWGTPQVAYYFQLWIDEGGVTDPYTITWTGTGEFRNSFTTTDTDGASDVELHMDGQLIKHSWYTTYPLVEYSRAISNIDGSSMRSQTGQTYSVRGMNQDTRTIKVQFDMQDYQLEVYHWNNLWKHYWRKARSVSLIAIAGDLIERRQPLSFSWGDTGAGRSENLVIPNIENPLFVQRLNLGTEKDYVEMEKPNLWISEQSFKFYVRRMRNMGRTNVDFGLRELVEIPETVEVLGAYYLNGFTEDSTLTAQNDLAGMYFRDGSSISFWLSGETSDEGGTIFQSYSGDDYDLEYTEITSSMGAMSMTTDSSSGFGVTPDFNPGFWTGTAKPWDHYLITRGSSGDLDVYRNGVKVTETPSPLGAATGLGTTPIFQFLANFNAYRVCNIALLDAIGQDVARSIYEAGVRWDLRQNYGDWVYGTSLMFYWRGAHPTAVPNLGSGGTCSLLLGGATTCEILGPDVIVGDPPNVTAGYVNPRDSGTGHYIDFDSDLLEDFIFDGTTGDIMIHFWTKGQYEGSGFVFAAGAENGIPGIQVVSDGALNCSITNDAGVNFGDMYVGSQPVNSDTAWKLVTIRISGGFQEYYVNGVGSGPVAVSGTFSSAALVTFLAYSFFSAEAAQGKIKNVLFCRRAVMSDAAIVDLYNAGHEHDAANPAGNNWLGGSVPFYYKLPVSGGLVPNSGSGGTCNMRMNGDCYGGINV